MRNCIKYKESDDRRADDIPDLAVGEPPRALREFMDRCGSEDYSEPAVVARQGFESDYRVLFTTAANAIASLTEEVSGERVYIVPPLLIIEEIGYLTQSDPLLPAY